MKLYLDSPKWGGTTIYRQTSQFSGIAGSHQWSSFPGCGYDYIICGEINRHPKWMQAYPKEKKILILHENPLIWEPTRDELDRFGVIIGPWKSIKRKLTDQIFIQSHSAVPWFYGVDFRTDQGLLHHPLKSIKELDYLERDEPPTKTKLISFIVSAKGTLEGHRWRIAVAEELATKYPGKVDLFGFGHRSLPDKAAALDPYKYSVVIENSPSESYWTEKLSDCILGRALPIYSGARNARRDLGIDFPIIEFASDPSKTAKKILELVELNEADCGEIEECRKRILGRHNMMHWIPYLIESNLL